MRLMSVWSSNDPCSLRFVISYLYFLRYSAYLRKRSSRMKVFMERPVRSRGII
jgi:hypothetical protein